MDQDSDSLRSLSDSKILLNALKDMALNAESLIKETPSLETLFEKEFGKFKDFVNRENIIETIFLDDFLLPDVEEFPLNPDQEVDSELVHNYVQSFQDYFQNFQA